MAITDVDVSDIAGYISKGTLGSSNASLAVLAQLEGNGDLTNFYTDFNQNSIGYKLSVAKSSNLDSNIHASFKFDPYYIDPEQRPIDLYDSTSNSDCAIIFNNDGSDTTSGTPGTLSGDLTFTRTTGTGDGGYISPGSANTSNNVAWPKPTKSGTDYETINGSTGKTFCFWYKPKTEQPSSFAYMIADNQLTTGRYSGVIIQRPSNRTLAFTILCGNNGGGTSSGNRRSHLGVNNSLAAEEWQFIVVRAKPGSSQGTSNTYVSITTAGAGSISTSNDGVSGTSGSGSSIGYNTSTSATMKWFRSGGVAATAVTADIIGMMWVLPFGLDAGSSYLSDIFDSTKELYGG